MVINSFLQNFIINPYQLRKIKNSEDLKIIDCRWYLKEPRRGRIEFKRSHIEKAIFFDVDRLSNTSSKIPHMLPTANQFSRFVQKNNIQRNDKIIVYDQVGFFSSSRVWFSFKYFGFPCVRILNGGYRRWKEKEHTSNIKNLKKNNSLFNFMPKLNLVIKKRDLEKSLEKRKFKIIDARPKSRFEGIQQEPRPGLIKGNIKSSINIPFDKITKKNGYLKNLRDLENIILKNKIYRKDNIVCYCGSGITACNIIFVLSILGFKKIKLYDGSWSEWGKKN